MAQRAMMVAGHLMMVCGYKATCDKPTNRAYKHPALGPVPICSDCATFAEITPEYTCEVTT